MESTGHSKAPSVPSLLQPPPTTCSILHCPQPPHNAWLSHCDGHKYWDPEQSKPTPAQKSIQMDKAKYHLNIIRRVKKLSGESTSSIKSASSQHLHAPPMIKSKVIDFHRYQSSHTHRIHVWYIYPPLVDFYGKCR